MRHEIKMCELEMKKKKMKMKGKKGKRGVIMVGGVYCKGITSHPFDSYSYHYITREK